MKYFILSVIVATLGSSWRVLAQDINSITVSGSADLSLSDISDEFFEYHDSYSHLDRDNSYISTEFGITCSNSILMWDEANGYTRHTARQVRAYAVAHRAETNGTRKSAYSDRATKGAEYLLCTQRADNSWDIDPRGLVYTNGSERHFASSLSGMALIEAYLSFGDSDYLDAAKDAADWLLSNPTYPFDGLSNPNVCPSGSDAANQPCDHYSVVNHIALDAEFLSFVYEFSGQQEYIDRAIEIVEEIIAWQDYDDSRDNWSVGAIPDGSWYWYNFSANPAPSGSPSSPKSTGSFHPDRRMNFHAFTSEALATLLRTVRQHTLPGTTTERNADDFLAFRESLVDALVAATNFAIDNQETTDSGTDSFRSGLHFFKDETGWTNVSSSYSNDRTTGGSLQLAVQLSKSLVGNGTLSSSDVSKLTSFIRGIAANHEGEYTNSAEGDDWTISMMLGWAYYFELVSEGMPSSSYSLTNPNFEDDRIVWELWSWGGSDDISISSSSSKSSPNSVHMDDNSSSESMWVGQTISVPLGANSVVAAAWSRLLSGCQAFYVEYLDSDMELTDFDYNDLCYQSGSPWVNTTLNESLPSGTKFVRLKAQTWWAGTSEGYWDSFTLSFGFPDPRVGSEEERERAPLFEVSPNPFQDEITVRIIDSVEDDCEISVVDMTGRLVARQRCHVGKNIVHDRARPFATGRYLLIVRTNQGRSSTVILKK